MSNSIFLKIVFGLAQLGTMCLVNAETVNQFHHGTAQWEQLKYSAATFFVSAETTLRKQKVEGGLLRLNADDLAMPGESAIFKIDNESNAMGKRTRYLIWFGEDGRVFQRTRIRRGDKNEIKVYRYARCGFYSVRKKFSSKEFDEQFSGWDPEKYSTKQFNSPLCDAPPIIQVDTLTYLVSTLELRDKGDAFKFTAISNGRLFKVDLKAEGKTDIEVDYMIHSATGKRRVETDRKEVLKITVQPSVDKEKFRFLGLKGNITLYLDLKTRLVLRIKGEVDFLGNLNINLTDAHLNGTASSTVD